MMVASDALNYIALNLLPIYSHNSIHYDDDNIHAQSVTVGIQWLTLKITTITIFFNMLLVNFSFSDPISVTLSN